MSKSFAPRWPRIAAALALCLACATPALAAIDEDDLLPVDQAFALTAKATSADRIALEWKIADGYYLYRHRTKAVAADGSRLGELDLPRGEPHEDEFFGHRSEEQTSALQSLMRSSYAVFCFKKKNYYSFFILSIFFILPIFLLFSIFFF